MSTSASTPEPTARVWRVGDPQPAERVSLLDSAGDVEIWELSRPHWEGYLDQWGPVVEVVDYAAAVAADERRRSQGDVAGVGQAQAEPCL